MLVSQVSVRSATAGVPKTSFRATLKNSPRVVASSVKAVIDHPVDYALKGWEALRRQNYNLASASSNLRTASRQFRPLLGTGLVSGFGATSVYLGFAAAGLRAAGGVQTLVGATQERDLRKGLDGIRDLGSAAVLGLASASMFALRRMVLPATAGFNTFRGAFNYVGGRKTGDKRRQAQGALDGVRGLGLTARSLQRFSPLLGLAGKVLAPVAGALQAHQGIKSLATGLVKNQNKMELKGLVDISSAVGMTLLLTGVAATPGLAIFSAAQGIYGVYNFSKTVRKIVDVGIDKAEPTGLKVLAGAMSVKECLRSSLEKFTSPFPALFSGSETDADVDARRTAERLEEDGWEAFVTIWADSDPTLQATVEPLDPEEPDSAFA